MDAPRKIRFRIRKIRKNRKNGKKHAIYHFKALDELVKVAIIKIGNSGKNPEKSGKTGNLKKGMNYFILNLLVSWLCNLKIAKIHISGRVKPENLKEAYDI